MIASEVLFVAISILILVSIFASKLSGRLGVPALLLFLVIGMLAGSEGPGGIEFDSPAIAQLAGITALIFILFDGGLSTSWQDIRPVLRYGVSLSTLGVLITMILIGVFVNVFTDFSLLESMLLGAIMSSTDAAAVFSVLRSRSVSLRGLLRPALELESGSNDPMAVFLTISFVQLIIGATGSYLMLVWSFVLQMTVGAAIGYAIGRAMVSIINHIHLEYEGLYPVLTMALVALTYGVSTLAGGNGFLSTYVLGLVAGSHTFIHKNSLVRFHDGLAWLMQITMFLTLGLLVFPSQLIPIAGVGLAVSAFSIVVARPVAVFIALSLSRFVLTEKAMISWVGLRGAAPIILATFPLVAGIPRSNEIFNIVFFIVLTSAVVQGTSIPIVARLLRVHAPLREKPTYPLEFVPTPDVDSELIELEVKKDSALAGRQVVEAGLPEKTLIVLLSRGDSFIVPNGATVLKAGDRLLILANKDKLESIRSITGLSVTD